MDVPSKKSAETGKKEKPSSLFVVLASNLMIAIFIVLALLYIPLIEPLVNYPFFLREALLVDRLTPNQSFQALSYYRRWLKDDHLEYKGRIYRGAIMQTALAEYHFDRKEFDKAKKILQKVVSRNYQFPLAYNLLGIIYSTQSNKALAIETYKKGINLAPSFAKDHLALLHENLGLVYFDLNQLDNAIDAFEKAKLQDPEEASIYTNLCVSLQRVNKFEEAISACRTGLKLDPSDALTHNNLGYTLALQGNINEAVIEFKKALIFDPTLKIAQENLNNYQNKK